MLTIESLNDAINNALARIPIYLSIRNFLVVYLIEEEQAIISLISLWLSSSLRLLFGISKTASAPIILKSGGNRILSLIILLNHS